MIDPIAIWLMRPLSPFHLFFWIALGSGLAGCSKAAKEPVAPAPAEECPPGQTFDGQFCQVTGAPPPEAPPAAPPAEPAATPAGSAAGAATAAPPLPEATGPTTPAEGAPSPEAPPSLATPVDVSMAAQAGPLITYLAGSHLPAGARPFGAPFAAQFAEGQIFEQQLKLSVGKCYTVVAAGLPPMTEVALELYDHAIAGGTPTAGSKPLLVDDATGPQAVIGSRAACFKPAASDLWLVVRAAKGQGVVAGQVFEK